MQEIENGVHWRKLFAQNPNPSTPTILFLHGLGESELCFERLVRRPELAEFHRWTVDLPNYGKSLRSDPPLRLAELADWVCRRLRTAPGPVILFGHSMGGVLGQLICEREPAEVVGFVNVEGNLSLQDCAFSGPAAEQSLEAFLKEGLARLLDQVYRDGLVRPAMRGYYASLRLARPEQFHLHSRELVAMSAREDLAGRFARLRLPVKIYAAGLDGGAGQRSLQLLDEAGVDWIGFKKSGHWPFIDEEDRFAGLLREWCGG